MPTTTSSAPARRSLCCCYLAPVKVRPHCARLEEAAAGCSLAGAASRALPAARPQLGQASGPLASRPDSGGGRGKHCSGAEAAAGRAHCARAAAQGLGSGRHLPGATCRPDPMQMRLEHSSKVAKDGAPSYPWFRRCGPTSSSAPGQTAPRTAQAPLPLASGRTSAPRPPPLLSPRRAPENTPSGGPPIDHLADASCSPLVCQPLARAANCRPRLLRFAGSDSDRLPGGPRLPRSQQLRLKDEPPAPKGRAPARRGHCRR